MKEHLKNFVADGNRIKAFPFGARYSTAEPLETLLLKYSIVICLHLATSYAMCIIVHRHLLWSEIKTMKYHLDVTILVVLSTRGVDVVHVKLWVRCVCDGIAQSRCLIILIRNCACLLSVLNSSKDINEFRSFSTYYFHDYEQYRSTYNVWNSREWWHLTKPSSKIYKFK